MPCLSYATGSGFNQEVVDYVHDSSLKRNMVNHILVHSFHLGAWHSSL